MSPVTITTTTMGFSVPVDRKGRITGSSLTIMEYSKKFEYHQFNQQTRRWELTSEFFSFDSVHERCYFPRYDLNKFIEFLTSRNTPYSVIETPPTIGAPALFHMLPHVSFKNDKQKSAVEFLTNAESGPLRGLALQTGVGKTVAYIWALQLLGVRSLTTMTSRLEQWVRELGAYTTLEEDDIYVIQGVGSLTKLFNQIDKQIKPKVILGSSKTIRNYLDYGPGYQHLPPPSEMCEKLGLGIVGTDEYHEHFYTNFLIGLILNPALFIPITATFLANTPFIKNIFDQFIPKNIQFSGGEYDRFVNVTAYRYTSGGFHIKPFHYMSPRGYSQVMFEKYLLNRGRKVLDPLIQDAIIPIVKTHYINVAEPGERFLFLCSTTKLCDHLVNVFARAFPTKKVTAFYAGIPESVLGSYDMILSTPGSAGTGRDVKNLRTCFVFESVESEIRNTQFIGRLRGPPQMMNTPEFVYLYFSCIPQHERYATARAMLYGPRALQLRHRSI